MPIKPIAYLVLVRPDEVMETTESGLVLAVDKKMEANAQVSGTIIDIGPDVYTAFKPTLPHAGLKIGDKVFYAKYAGKWIVDKKTREELLMLRDEDIVGKWEDEGDYPKLAS